MTMTAEQLTQLDMEFARAIGLNYRIRNNRCAVFDEDGEFPLPPHQDWNLVMPEVVTRQMTVTVGESYCDAYRPAGGCGSRLHTISAYESPNQAAIVACMKAVIEWERAK